MDIKQQSHDPTSDHEAIFYIKHLGSSDDGLSLELSAQSPSDSEHWFKTSYLGADGENRNDGTGVYGKKAACTIHDPKHEWVDGRQVAVPDGYAMLRLFEKIDLRFKEELPEVHAVTKLVLRRQCRRRFVPRALWALLDKLPRLKHIVYEPWRVLDRTVQELQYDTGNGLCCLPLLKSLD